MTATDNLKAVLEKVKGAVNDRDKFEQLLQKRLGSAFTEQRKELIRLLGDPPSMGNVPESYWNNGGKAIRKAVTAVFESIYIAQAVQFLEKTRVAVDWALLNRRAVEWASQHAGYLMGQLEDTTRRTLADYISRYYTDSWTLDDLADRLAPLFGEQRAMTIAITETTLAATQSEMAMVNWLESEFPSMSFEGIWMTANDDRVCDICGPKQGKPITDGEYPPAHINCRCEVEWKAKFNE